MGRRARRDGLRGAVMSEVSGDAVRGFLACLFPGDLRPGDILGALTAGKELAGNQIGKIDLFDFIAYVAVQRDVARDALKILSEGKIKGRKIRVRKL